MADFLFSLVLSNISNWEKLIKYENTRLPTGYFGNYSQPAPAELKCANNYQFTRNIVGEGDDNKDSIVPTP